MRLHVPPEVLQFRTQRLRLALIDILLIETNDATDTIRLQLPQEGQSGRPVAFVVRADQNSRKKIVMIPYIAILPVPRRKATIKLRIGLENILVLGVKRLKILVRSLKERVQKL
jgi:hypothetical protein